MENERRIMIRELRGRSSAQLLYKFNTIPVPATKSAQEALSMRNKARFLFQRDKHDITMHETIWAYATRSVAYAPPNSESLALAYTERSRILLHTKHFRECIVDCDRALAIEVCPIQARLAAYNRKIECSLILGIAMDGREFAEAQACFEQATGRGLTLDALDLGHKSELLMNDPLAYVVEPGEQRDFVEPTTEAVEVGSNSRLGRLLVASRDIHCGEVVLVEPYGSASLSRSIEGRTCCRHCLKLSWTLLPCDTCHDFVFCSESCRDQAWEEYHSVECALMHAIQDYYVYLDENIVLGLKLVLKGIKEAGSIENLKKIVAEIDASKSTITRGMTDRKFASNFRAFYSLIGIFPNTGHQYLIFANVLMIVALARFTPLFGPTFSFDSCSDLARDHDVVFIGALLLKMATMCTINAKKFMERNAEMKADLRGSIVYCRKADYVRGIVITPYASLINHSCNPNVQMQHTDDGKLMYFSLMPIPKGHQIFECYYQPFYSTQTLEERQRVLNECYMFKCHCDACIFEWSPTSPHPDQRFEHLEIDPDIFQAIEIAGPLVQELRELLAALSTPDYFSMLGIRRISARAIEALTVFPFPNPVTLIFIYALRYAFEYTHGILSRRMPASCGSLPMEMTPDVSAPMEPPKTYSIDNISRSYVVDKFGY